MNIEYEQVKITQQIEEHQEALEKITERIKKIGSDLQQFSKIIKDKEGIINFSNFKGFYIEAIASSNYKINTEALSDLDKTKIFDLTEKLLQSKLNIAIAERNTLLKEIKDYYLNS